MDARTKITLVWELHESGVSNCQIAGDLSLNHETVGNYIRGITEQGLVPFLESYRSGPRKSRPSRQVPMSVKQKVWALRDRELGCCGQKIAYFLEKEEGIHLSVPNIYEILEEKYTLGRPRSRKRTKRGPVPEACAPREVVQMDTIDFGKVFAHARERAFAFTVVDIYSRVADIYLAPALTALEGRNFLLCAFPLRFEGFVKIIQTDGGSEFEGEFAATVGNFCERHRVSRPYRKNEQSYIESFNRTVRAELLGWDEYGSEEIPCLQPQADAYLERYHYHRPHLGLEPLRPPLWEEI